MDLCTSGTTVQIWDGIQCGFVYSWNIKCVGSSGRKLKKKKAVRLTVSVTVRFARSALLRAQLHVQRILLRFTQILTPQN